MQDEHSLNRSINAQLLPGQLAQENASAPARLSWFSFVLCLGIGVAIFLYFNPIWAAVEIGDLDRGILWSYGALPLLAWAALSLEKNFGWASLFLESLKLIFTKFALTYALASIGWMLIGLPLAEDHDRVAYAGREPEQAFAPTPAPAATPLDPAQTGALRGRVLDPKGVPLAGVLVYVESGLGGVQFEVPSAALELRCTPDGCHPKLLVLRAHQSLRLISADSELHTVQMSALGQHSVLNHPCTPGSEREIMFDHALGLLRLSCRVHGERERAAHLLVTGNPFFAFSDADGRFAFERVPAGRLRIGAWSSLLGSCGLDALVRAQKPAASVTLQYTLSQSS